jgi:hypothetical protein
MLKQYFFNKTKGPRPLVALLVILTITAVGSYLLAVSHASSPYAAVTGDSGTVAGGAAKQACSNASDGNCVVFNGQAATGITYGTILHPFATDAPINTPIPANPKYTSSTSTVASVGGEFQGYGWPLYAVNSPLASVTCSQYCYSPFKAGQTTSMPIPSGMKLSTGSDAAAGVVDPSTGQTYELWQASGGGTSWRANGAGSGNITSSSIIGNATGSNISIFAGTVLLADLNSGVINHALNFAIGTTCSTYVYPANKSDGHGSSGCIPEGARVQLDPSVNLSNMTPFEQMIGKAFQVYGAYCTDTAGNGNQMAVRFEDPVDIGVTGALSAGQANYYASHGNIRDSDSSFSDLNKLPASDWHILNSWNGQ